MISDLTKAKVILQATRSLLFDEYPAIDLRDRLALLTVVADFREVAAFGFDQSNNEGRMRRLKDVLSNHGLPAQLTRQVRPVSNRCFNISSELANVLDRCELAAYQGNTSRLLWVCRNPEIRQQIKRAVAQEISTGTLLGYPQCCVDDHRQRTLKEAHAFSDAIIGAVGNDLSAVERALRKGFAPDLSADPHAGISDGQFPFLQHLACASCLSSDDSPSGRLNFQYGQLALETSPELHHTLLEMAKLMRRLTGTSKSDPEHRLILDDMKRVHAEFLRG